MPDEHLLGLWTRELLPEPVIALSAWLGHQWQVTAESGDLRSFNVKSALQDASGA